MSNSEEKAKQRRPWQFSLRFLMLLMLVTGAFFGGWVANDWKRKRELRLQQAATPTGLFTIIEFTETQSTENLLELFEQAKSK